MDPSFPYAWASPPGDVRPTATTRSDAAKSAKSFPLAGVLSYIHCSLSSTVSAWSQREISLSFLSFFPFLGPLRIQRGGRLSLEQFSLTVCNYSPHSLRRKYRAWDSNSPVFIYSTNESTLVLRIVGWVEHLGQKSAVGVYESVVRQFLGRNNLSSEWDEVRYKPGSIR